MGESLQFTPLILHFADGTNPFDRVSQYEDDLQVRLKTKHVQDGFIRKPGRNSALFLRTTYSRVPFDNILP